MYEIIKAIAAANGWEFDYGSRDFQNLYDNKGEEGTVYIFSDPIKEDTLLGDTGLAESYKYSGTLFLFKSSKLDEESYIYRKETYIEPLKANELSIVSNTLSCEYRANITKWGVQEIINMLDFNGDGLMIDFELTIEA